MFKRKAILLFLGRQGIYELENNLRQNKVWWAGMESSAKMSELDPWSPNTASFTRAPGGACEQCSFRGPAQELRFEKSEAGPRNRNSYKHFPWSSGD